MKFLPLVWASLFHKKTRLILTLLSLTAAFMLFGLLQAVSVLFSSGADFVGANRLITQAKVSFTQPLPLALLPRIEAIPGVARVAWSQFFGGIYIEERNFFPQFAVDPERLLDSYPEWKLPDDQRKAFVNTQGRGDRRPQAGREVRLQDRRQDSAEVLHLHQEGRQPRLGVGGGRHLRRPGRGLGRPLEPDVPELRPLRRSAAVWSGQRRRLHHPGRRSE